MMQWILTSCVLILAVLGLRLVLKGRISLRLQYALWLLVAVRLLVPLTFGESNISAANLSLSAQPMVQQMEAVEIPVQSFDSAYEEVVWEHIDQGQDISGFENTEELEYEAYERMEKVSLSEILTTVWIAGMALSFAVLLFSNLHFAAKLRRTRRPIVLPNATLPVYCAPQIVTPCLFGLFRPAIYLTEDVLADPQALNHVLAHEHTHHRHGDHLWAALRGICLCIHWYNPLVWIAATVSRSDGELACDEAAIASLGEENRLDYGRTLIGLTCAKGVSPLLTATTMTGSKHSIKERITLIAKKPEFSLIALIALILAVTVAAGCSFTGPVSPKAENTPNKYQIMAYPGTEWGMTPEEVMEALDLTEKDLVDWQENELTCSFRVEDIKYLGFRASLCFRFQNQFSKNSITPQGPGFGLFETHVVFPEDTDMSAVLKAMTKEYGEPTDANSTTTSSPGIYVGSKKDAQGHVVRWDSAETQIDTISPAQYNRFVMSTATTMLFQTPSTEELEKAKAETNLYLDKPAANIYWADNTHWLYFGEEREDRPYEKAIVFQGNQLCDDRLVFDHVPEFTVTVPRLPQHSRLEYSFTLLATAKIAELKNFNDVTIDQVKVNVTLMETDAVDNSKLQELVVYKLDIRLHPENRKNVPEGTPMENGWILAETEGGPMYYFAIISSKDPSELVWPIGGISELELLETYSTPELIEQYGDAFNAAAHQKGTENNLYFG